MHRTTIITNKNKLRTDEDNLGDFLRSIKHPIEIQFFKPGYPGCREENRSTKWRKICQLLVGKRDHPWNPWN
jgi:hypothetical protein